MAQQYVLVGFRASVSVRTSEVSGTEPRSENGWSGEREHGHVATVRPPQLFFTQHRAARKAWEEKMEPKSLQTAISMNIYIYIYIYIPNMLENWRDWREMLCAFGSTVHIKLHDVLSQRTEHAQ